MSEKIIILIIAIIIIAIFAVNFTGLWPFLNRPINYLVAGTPDESCLLDSDCKIKQTHCGYCGDCGNAVNKNWQQYCPFKNHYFTIYCEPCPPLQVRCLRGACRENIKQQVVDFESCIAAGNPVMETYPRQCSADGQTFTEILAKVGDSCIQSADCQLPMDYAVRSNCPYQAYCYNQKCVVGCPLWQEKTNTWEVKCQADKDCNCAAWNEQTNYICACVDGQCASLVEDNTAENQLNNNLNANVNGIIEPTCKNMCGDGICQEIVCLAIGCPCAETAQNCPQDCKK
ncbi:MAG: hypothetical protein A2Y67_04390 [Candidatus Buchananbacteria bacterium RBG_13_39_9]|uniref:Uncharacterized protein n=1 Tax=Candidatus Buchananbacteria bacterium RBG_13_39_9 TaxID=1797531 RepID=A0A1G1XSP2_9BACT|nr:MAG: hypothetical protein A2Y67_04390 [Candidatus Buchananbacteria bacterium RBG_13_39_9]